jgi:DNA repair protein RadC
VRRDPRQRRSDHRGAQSSQGDPTPSAEDVHVTRQMVEAGKLLNIDVLDHLVITQSRWVSLKERGLGF